MGPIKKRGVSVYYEEGVKYNQYEAYPRVGCVAEKGKKEERQKNVIRKKENTILENITSYQARGIYVGTNTYNS